MSEVSTAPAVETPIPISFPIGQTRGPKVVVAEDLGVAAGYGSKRGAEVLLIDAALTLEQAAAAAWELALVKSGRLRPTATCGSLETLLAACPD